MSIFTPTARRRRICRRVVYLLLALLFAVAGGLRVSGNRDGVWAAVVIVDLLAVYASYAIWFRCEHCHRFIREGWSRARYCQHCGGPLG